MPGPAKTAGNVTGGIFIPITVSFSEEGAWKLQKWATKPPIEFSFTRVLPALNSFTEDQFVPILSPTQFSGCCTCYRDPNDVMICICNNIHHIHMHTLYTYAYTVYVCIHSRDATVHGNAPFQCFGCTRPPTHKLDPLHPACSFSNTTAVYFKLKARNSVR